MRKRPHKTVHRTVLVIYLCKDPTFIFNSELKTNFATNMTVINDEALGRLVFRRSSYRAPSLSDCSVRPTHFETGNIAVMADCLYYAKFRENRGIGSEVTAGSVRRLAYGYCKPLFLCKMVCENTLKADCTSL